MLEPSSRQGRLALSALLRTPTSAAMMLRFLFSLIVGLGLLLSPVMMASGGGMALAHSTSVEMVEADGHCAGSEAPADEPSPQAKMSCATACAAFTPLSPAVRNQLQHEGPKAAMPPPQFLAGIHPEGETPPPRITPEI